jgi:hypothetical protein
VTVFVGELVGDEVIVVVVVFVGVAVCTEGAVGLWLQAIGKNHKTDNGNKIRPSR